MQWCRIAASLFLLVSHTACPAELVTVPAGTFKHPVLLDREVQVETVDTFLIDPKPVSRASFAHFVAENEKWRRSHIPRLFHDGGYLRRWLSDDQPQGDPEAPVTHVSWYAARAYCQSRGGALPDLVQWEYLVSLIRQRNRIADNDYARSVFAWYGEQRSGGFVDSHFSITGMVGQVNEWVEDYQLLLSNGEKIDFGGGSCGDTGRLMAKYDSAHYATFLRYQSRSNYSPETTTSNLGFRCAYTLE